MSTPSLVTDDPRITEDPLLLDLCQRIVERLVEEGFELRAQETGTGPTWDGSADDSLEAAVGRAVLDSCRTPARAPRHRRRPARRRPARHRTVRLRTTRARTPRLPAVLHRVCLVPRRRGARPMSAARRARYITAFAWVQNIGAVLILFAAWQVWGTAISEHHAQHDLAAQFARHTVHAGTGRPLASPAAIAKSKPTIVLAPRTAPLPNPAEGKVMAHLQIPVIGLDQYVVSGTAAADLALGPGHYPGTALPGQAGNVAIAGHRTTHGAPFYHLGDLAIGNEIILTTTSGEALTYFVSAPPTPVSPSDTSVLGDFGDNRLTLTTCTPPYSAAQRLVVVASLRLPGVPQAFEHLARTAPKPYRSLAAADTSSWDLAQLPLVALESLCLLGLGLANRRLGRIYGRTGRWLVLTPIWVAVLYVLFEALTKLLPASV